LAINDICIGCSRVVEEVDAVFVSKLHELEGLSSVDLQARLITRGLETSIVLCSTACLSLPAKCRVSNELTWRPKVTHAPNESFETRRPDLPKFMYGIALRSSSGVPVMAVQPWEAMLQVEIITNAGIGTL
jgi:hypothetical protein